MAHFRATNKTSGEVIEYDAALPQSEHLGEGWRLEEVSEAFVAPDAPVDTRMYGGRRWLTKVEFVELLGFSNYVAILAAARTDPAIEAWVRLVELTAMNADQTSVFLDDPRMQPSLSAFESAGLIAAGTTERVMNG